ncbi:MAG: LssY C-terminal domain-containing protein [Nocardioides sp.]|uniref:LssY C-terminal domain-containing protein n=1 Tax=Nocardioides sp. TaxID=35761 RepID=UPI0039E721B3
MSLPTKVRTIPGVVADRAHLVDRIFFGLGTIAAIWLAYALVQVNDRLTWWTVVALVVFWLVLAYLALPRLNRILASIYVPDYFIGRTRTSDGLLGDPLNLAVRGTAEQLATVMKRAGWTLADPVDLSSSAKIVAATLARRSYPEAPVSPLFLFGRAQDAAYQQEVDGNPGQRHHVRFWRTPDGWPLPGGHRVDWLGGGTYDRRVGLSLFTLQVTHKIDADIDVERDHVVDTVQAAAPEAKVVPLVDFTTSYHSRNGGGDAIHTDGTLPILELAAVAPDPGAPDLRPVVSDRIPIQVVLPIATSLLAAVWFVITAVTVRSGENGLAWTALGLAVANAALAIAVLRRSAIARRTLLVIAVVSVLLRATQFHVVDDGRLQALAHAAVSVLELIALSSSAASRWTRRR